MLSKNYLKSLNSTLEQLNNANTRVAAQRKYMRFAEDPATALKAMKIRKQVSNIEVYQSNLKDIQGILDQYETSISNVNDLVKEIVAQVMQASTGTSGESVIKTVAETLRNYQKDILSALNAKYADDYIFGGDNVEGPPFSENENHELLYFGQEVGNMTEIPEEHRYVDIGLGLVDASGKTTSKTAFDLAVSGIKLISIGDSCGNDAEGISYNLYNLIDQIADKLENNDISNLEAYTDRLQEIAENVRLQYVSIGEKSNYVKYMQDRLDAEKVNALKMQNDLESLDTAEGIIEFTELEFAYNACLAMGTKLLQPSLLDYLK